MEIDNDFKEWLVKHKNVTVEKFNNLNGVFQHEIMQVYKNEKAVESLIK